MLCAKTKRFSCFAIATICLAIFVSRAIGETVYKFSVPPWDRGKTGTDYRLQYKPLLKWLEQRSEVRLCLSMQGITSRFQTIWRTA